MSHEMTEMRITALKDQLVRAKGLIHSLVTESQVPMENTLKRKLDDDTYYFHSYSHSLIHEIMIQDRVRTGAYRDAICSNAKELFRDKIVLDIGCGTGILSLFAAQAGAKKVFAIDASDICKDAAAVTKLNGFDDTIVVIQG